MAKSIPWGDIKHAYVTTDDSLTEIANRFGTGLSQVKKRAAAEGWTEDRNRFRTETELKTTEKTSERISDERSEINAKHYEIWGKLIEKIELALLAVADPSEIETLTRALDKAQKGQRLSKDMVTEKTSTETTGAGGFVRSEGKRDDWRGDMGTE